MDTKNDLSHLLPKMEAFIKTLYHINVDLDIRPKKKHIVTCIEHQDLSQLRKEFLRELIASITRFVYSRAKSEEIIDRLLVEHEPSDAYALLTQQARDKFRPSSVQGQFSELLLFNLLLHHFQAVPIIRKMKITTNVELERNGADAIHLAKINGKYVIYLGEAKTYTSGFKAAFKNALNSVLDTFDNHRNELNLYKFEDFLERDVLDIAQQYIDLKLDDIEVHLVCIITFCAGKVGLGGNRAETIQKYLEIVKGEIAKIKDSDYPQTEHALMARMNYILMPVEELDELLETFRQKLGI